MIISHVAKIIIITMILFYYNERTKNQDVIVQYINTVAIKTLLLKIIFINDSL